MFEERGDAMSCGSHRGVRLLEHVMKIAERLLEKQIQTMLTIHLNEFVTTKSLGPLNFFQIFPQNFCTVFFNKMQLTISSS